MKKVKSPRRVFGYVRWSCFLFWNTKSHRMWVKQPFLWTSQSERRHAVEMKAGPLRAADVFISVHVRAVAMLVCALWRLVGVILTYLLILWLLFNESLWRGLCCTAITLVSRPISKGSVHLLLENMRQGVQRDAAHWAVQTVVTV